MSFELFNDCLPTIWLFEQNYWHKIDAFKKASYAFALSFIMSMNDKNFVVRYDCQLRGNAPTTRGISFVIADKRNDDLPCYCIYVGK